MFFTSQYLSIGQQVSSTCSTPRSVYSLYEMNWPSVFLCTNQEGTSLAQCTWPGNGNDSFERVSRSNAEMLAQNHLTMKNARKQIGEIAAKDATQINPGPIVSDNPDSLPYFEDQIFHEKPRPRQPESPDVESFRSWLKTNSRHKASPALLERIKTIPNDDKS